MILININWISWIINRITIGWYNSENIIAGIILKSCIIFKTYIVLVIRFNTSVLINCSKMTQYYRNQSFLIIPIITAIYPTNIIDKVTGIAFDLLLNRVRI